MVAETRSLDAVARRRRVAPRGSREGQLLARSKSYAWNTRAGYPRQWARVIGNAELILINTPSTYVEFVVVILASRVGQEQRVALYACR